MVDKCHMSTENSWNNNDLGKSQYLKKKSDPVPLQDLTPIIRIYRTWNHNLNDNNIYTGQGI
jgi:hypothetical protein